MSASLVGSEMCIRDRPTHEPSGGGASARGCEGEGALGLCDPAVRGAVGQRCTLPARTSRLRDVMERPGHEEAPREAGSPEWHRAHVPVRNENRAAA
eukprot:12242518-Alexandrium_andersonii.AAC.1